MYIDCLKFFYGVENWKCRSHVLKMTMPLATAKILTLVQSVEIFIFDNIKCRKWPLKVSKMDMFSSSGTITVIDDILTSSPDLGTQNVGRAQGVYVASSADGLSQLMAFTAMLEGGE